MSQFDSDEVVDQYLRDFRSGGVTLGSERRSRIDARLAAELEASPETTDHSCQVDLNQVVSNTEHRRLKAWTLAYGSAAAILVIALVVVLMRPAADGEMVAGPAPIGRDDLVVAARGSADHRLLSGSQLYRRVLVARRHAPKTVVVRTTESWVAADGSGELDASAESVLDGPVSDGLRLAPKLSVQASAGELDFAGYSYAQLRGLPSDGRQLLNDVEFRVRSEDPASPAVASLLAELLSLDVAPPGVRAAVVDALFRIGAVGVGRVRAPDGRLGEALLGESGDGRQWMLILDEHAMSLAFLAGDKSMWSEHLQMDHVDNWTTFGATALTRSGD